LGQTHPDLPTGWLYFRHKRWLVVFELNDDGISILRVVDATRDLPRLFGKAGRKNNFDKF
jgi:plasmid stabilization system protein ParE